MPTFNSINDPKFQTILRILKCEFTRKFFSNNTYQLLNDETMFNTLTAPEGTYEKDEVLRRYDEIKDLSFKELSKIGEQACSSRSQSPARPSSARRRKNRKTRKNHKTRKTRTRRS